jgi:hypothetical protein
MLTLREGPAAEEAVQRLPSSAKPRLGAPGRLAGSVLTVAAANIAGFGGNHRMDPESIAGEDAGAPRIFNGWTAAESRNRQK